MSGSLVWQRILVVAAAVFFIFGMLCLLAIGPVWIGLVNLCASIYLVGCVARATRSPASTRHSMPALPSDRGQSLIEFAVGMTLFLVLILGIIEGGLVI